MKQKLMPPQAFFKQGNNIGILLIHGFSGSTVDIYYLGEYLHRQGFTVNGILLKGHGTTVEDMAKTTWQDWYQNAEAALKLLQEQCEKVFVIGHSMGGLLALRLARNYDFEGAVTICSPIFLRNRKTYLAPFLQYFIKYANKGIDEDKYPLIQSRFTYSKVPMKCLASLVDLIKLTKKDLSFIKCPALVLQADADLTVGLDSANYLYQHLGSDNREINFISEAGHQVLLQKFRDIVGRDIVNFLTKLK